jgi:hypothetical protein
MNADPKLVDTRRSDGGPKAHAKKMVRHLACNGLLYGQPGALGLRELWGE